MKSCLQALHHKLSCPPSGCAIVIITVITRSFEVHIASRRLMYSGGHISIILSSPNQSNWISRAAAPDSFKWWVSVGLVRSLSLTINGPATGHNWFRYLARPNKECSYTLGHPRHTFKAKHLLSWRSFYTSSHNRFALAGIKRLCALTKRSLFVHWTLSVNLQFSVVLQWLTTSKGWFICWSYLTVQDKIFLKKFRYSNEYQRRCTVAPLWSFQQHTAPFFLDPSYKVPVS